jgi:polysaccharide biosynthesis transport protein
MLLPPGDDSPNPGLHLRDYWHVLLRRRWLALTVFLLIVGAGVARVRMVRPVYQATAQVLIDRQAPSILGFEGDVRLTDAREDFYQTQYRLLQSRLLARKVVERLGLLKDAEFGGPHSAAVVEEAQKAAPGTSSAMEVAIDAFQGRLKVEPLKNSQLVALRFQSYRPELAAQAANTLADVYIAQTREFRRRTSAEAGAWLDNETQEQARKIEAAELELQKLVERDGLGNIEERRVLVEQKLKDLGSALNAAKTRRLDKEALYRQMQSASNAEELPGALASPLIQALRAELATLERQHTQLLSKGYLDEYPEVVKVRQQIEGTNQKIAAEARRIIRAAENDYRAAVAQEGSTSGALEAATREALDLSRRGLKYDALKRDLEASMRLSESVLTRQKQTDASQNVPASNVHVIDAAVVPRSPIRPRPRRDFALALLLGLGTAVVAAFLRDYFDSSVSVPSDVRRLGLPVLGVIAEGSRRNGPPLLTGPRKEQPFDESYRVLRTALDPLDGGGHGQLLLVTSTLPGEGKSLTSVNLALTLASADERVLLIDADLRRPSLSALLKTRSTPGLSDVVNGRAKLEAAVHRVPGTRLSLMPSGTPVDRNPSDLLAKAAFRDLLAAVRGHFDRVVVDTAPAGVVADALTLAPLADGVLVVAHSGRVTTGALAQVLERLMQARAHVLGLVLNRARPDLLRYDYSSPLNTAISGARRLPGGAETGAREHDSFRRMN